MSGTLLVILVMNASTVMSEAIEDRPAEQAHAALSRRKRAPISTES
jgi:hypothetical protein